jgi:hypothetical protein
MKRISRYGLMLLAVLTFAAAPSVWATCNLDTQIVGHTLDGFITSCPDANPIEGYAWLLSNPAGANSAGQEIVCRFENQSIPDSGVFCGSFPGSGIAGDGVVKVYAEWGVQNGGIVGCPNLAQAGDGTTPMGVQVICNNGATALFELGWFGGLQQFALELAGPADGSPVAADFSNGPSVVSVSAGPSPSASNVCVNVPLPSYHSDCDATALGNGASCLDPASRPARQRGKLMATNGPCGTGPDLRVTGGPNVWALTPAQPDATGNACNVFTPPAGQCTFVGVQAVAGGVDAAGVIGWAQVGGQGASTDKVKIDAATATQGKVKVAFSTENETSIVGFNVYSDGAKLNGGLIASKGVGNNAYAFEIGRGALKGGKSVLVEAVMKDGTVAKTAPVSLK